MQIWIASFTRTGAQLCARLEDAFRREGDDCRGFAPARFAGRLEPLDQPVADWTGEAFSHCDAILFIGACGIAVRAVAPWLMGKAHDPAVAVVDEQARNAVSLLSGHLGGANRLAMRVAAYCGARPVITTATDLAGAFAVDVWAASKGYAVLEPGRIKEVSSRILEREAVGFVSEIPSILPPEGVSFAQDAPAGICVALSADPHPFPCTLHIVPPLVRIGIGCRRGISQQAVGSAVENALRLSGVVPESVGAVCTAALKADEPGLRAFCMARGYRMQLFSAGELAALEGDFTASEFVKSVTGVDNVCERAAIAGCGGRGRLLLKKTAWDGVTVAVAVPDDNRAEEDGI